MRPTRMTGWLAPPALLALALALGGSARADVCVAVNPVLEIGCRESGGAPTGGEPTQSSEPADAPQSEEVTRSSTEPRYDPRRLAITFRPGTSQATVRAVIDRAGTTLEEAIPKIHAYLVGVEPERRAEALRSFRSSSSVASAAQDLIAEALDTNPDDSDWPQQDGLRVVGFPKAWDVTRGSSRVIDTVIAAAIVWATDHGARVINLSLGGPGASQELSNAIAYAAGKGVTVVAAAGNSGTTTPFYPAADSRALSVAATTVADRRYPWSNFGPWVRVAAPGCNIAPVLSGGYGTFCGTSSATPLVAGLIALELSAEPTATAQDVEQALLRAVLPLPDVVQYGRIDAGRTLSLLRPSVATADFRGIVGGSIRARTYRFEVGDGALIATLRFGGRGRLAFALDKPKARAVGRSPVELRATTAAGKVTLRVSSAARTKTRFVLHVSYTLRPDQGSVTLSRLRPPIPRA